MCASCRLSECSLARANPAILRKVREYGVRMVPTIVVDGKIKVEGKPDFPWVCGDDFYAMLESRFPLRPALE